jgi:hypothetical protein
MLCASGVMSRISIALAVVFALLCLGVGELRPPGADATPDLLARAPAKKAPPRVKDAPAMTVGKDGIPIPPWLQQKKGSKRS